MGKWQEAKQTRERLDLELKRKRFIELQYARLIDRVESSRHYRNMWATGAYQTYNTPRIVGKSQKLAWRNNRKNAHPPFVNRSGRARSLPMA